MLFNSYIFILLFLPITIIFYFGLQHYGLSKLAKCELLAMSLIFYGYYNWFYLVIIITNIIINYIMSNLIRVSKNKKQKMIILIITITANLFALFYYKYFDFFVYNINSLFNVSFTIRNIILPLGISFITFQQISYIVDIYKNDKIKYSFLDYSIYVSFFPKLLAGPIVLHNEIIPQINNTKNWKVNYFNITEGIYYFAIGLSKKVILADTLAKAVSWGYGSADLMTSMDSFIVMVIYTFQIYFDFSGYSDMAIGISRMFNIILPVNFNSPYKALSLYDFWQRWHITITRFLREYIYFPLGGNRKGKVRTYINIIVIFCISGLWHGANWNFILWGLMHGIGSSLTRIFKKSWEKLHIVCQWGITFLFINVTWIFFRADSIKQACSILKNMFSMKNLTISDGLLNCFMLPEIVQPFIWLKLTKIPECIHGFYMISMLLFILFLILNTKNCQQKVFKPSLINALGSIILIVWSIISLSSVSTFLYYAF